jgi:hypothetical protein
MRIVDCTTTLVTASVRESLYNRLQVGEPVQVRLLGDSKVYDGVIARLAGSGAETIYRSLAIGPARSISSVSTWRFHRPRWPPILRQPAPSAAQAVLSSLAGPSTFGAG